MASATRTHCTAALLKEWSAVVNLVPRLATHQAAVHKGPRLIERTGPKLESVLQRELQNPGIHAGGCDLAEGRTQLHFAGARRSQWSIELCVIEGVEELGAKDDRLALGKLGRLHNGDVPIELTGPENGAHAGVAVAGSVAEDPSGWSRAKGTGIKVPRTTAIAAQALRQASAG